MDYKDYQDDSFEQFLQEEVNTHRMYPADDVWKNIRAELHGNRTWPALTVIALFIITSLTFSTILMTTTKEFRIAKENAAVEAAKEIAANNAANKSAIAKNYFNSVEPHRITAATISQIEEAASFSETSLQNNAAPEATVIIPQQNIQLPATQAITVFAAPLSNLHIAEALVAPEEPKEVIAFTGLSKEATKTVNQTSPIVAIEEIDKSALATKQLFSWKKISKLGFQFYITPSQSYRVLSDAAVKEIIQPTSLPPSSGQNGPLGLDYRAGVNDIVRHRPALGLELGIAALYKINDRLQLKTGLQMNIRQYEIETFRTRNSDLATISLLNGRGVENINLLSNYNNSGGYKPEQIANKTFELALPIGVQWQVLGDQKLGLNAEASVQPTYILSSNAMLLSTDFKNYTDGSAFARRWNVNTSIGVNLTFKTGSNFWQIGPQVRYQHLPSYTNQYPIKEFRLDYGIRLGITRLWK
ncbi:MAG: hypothetical protein K2X37_07025 [Chitinophagaceae bacterium]|nr:hypothetical protein [Chitinophagaceae bacterium]